MNIFKKIIIGISLVSISAISSFAQQPEHKHPKHEEMVKELNLTPEQEASMKAVKQKYKTQLKALKESTASKESKKAERKEIKDKIDTEIKSILSESQYANYITLKKEHKEERKAKYEENKQRLNLTAEQEVSMKSIKQKYKPQLIAVKESTSTKANKKSQRKEIHANMDTEVKSVLNDVQYSEYLKIKEEKKEERKKNK